MKIITTNIICDVCGKENIKEQEQKRFPVIFTTEQTEGRWCPPYFTEENIDLCDNCLAKMINGQQLYGSGAQGCNSYKFKGEE